VEKFILKMHKNLVIIPAGDNSLHKEWKSYDSNFDVVTIYYGDDISQFEKFCETSIKCIKSKGQKWFLLSDFLLKNLNFVETYDYIWFPDDDLLTTTNEINELFDINKTYNLWLSQPSLTGYVSYEIEKKVEGSLLRFTNFVEIICPIMSVETLKKLLFYFTINESGWGTDYLWPKLLNYPKDKIAIIDKVTVNHTKPIAGNYKNRFKKEPMQELRELFSSYGLTFSQIVYTKIDL